MLEILLCATPDRRRSEEHSSGYEARQAKATREKQLCRKISPTSSRSKQEDVSHHVEFVSVPRPPAFCRGRPLQIGGPPLWKVTEVPPVGISREGTSRLSGPSARRYGIWTAKDFCLRHRVLKSEMGQSSPASQSRLPTMPAVRRKGSLKSTLIERQNWMTASEKTGGRPGRPSCGASQAIFSSIQISREPRLHSATL